MEFESKAIRLQLERTKYREHSVPVFMTSSYVFENAEQMRAMFAGDISGDLYSRYSNPSVREFEAKIAALEETEDALATASGMAAIFASFAALLQSGDHIIAAKAIFGASYAILQDILSKWGIEHTLVDISKPKDWEQAIRPNTKMFFFETPSNPGLEIVDLEWISTLASKHNIWVNVDNCFATPFLQNPARYGIDIITHSATKYMDGQGRVLGGVVAGKRELIEQIRTFIKRTGPSLSPFNAWTLSKSLETLAVRMERHCDNALQLAQFLSTHAKVKQVKYPLLPTHPQYEIACRQMRLGGGILSFLIVGGQDTAARFLDALQMIKISANLGDARSIATHPTSSTHSKLTETQRLEVGIAPNLIRISVGLENIKDIIADVSQALDATE